MHIARLQAAINMVNVVSVAFLVATVTGVCVVCGFITNELKQTMRGLTDEIDKLRKLLRKTTDGTASKELTADCTAKTGQLVADNASKTEQLIASYAARTEQLIADSMTKTGQLIADGVKKEEQLIAKNITETKQLAVNSVENMKQLTKSCIAEIIEMTENIAKKADNTADAVNTLPDIIDATAKKYSMYLHDEHEKIVELMSGAG